MINTIVVSPLAPYSEADLNRRLTEDADARVAGFDGDIRRQAITDELHGRATREDAVRAQTEDEWTRGYLIAAAEWARIWPSDLL